MDVEMLPVNHLHLTDVLQTVSALESVILRTFGPEGGQALFTRDTGQAMLSRSGICILTALRLEHPLARMVVECVWKHSTLTGDGSKTFILLLASLLRIIHSMACKESNVSQTYNLKHAVEAATARRLADELLKFALEDLVDVIARAVVPYGHCLSWDDCTVKTQLPAHSKNPYVQRLLASFYYSRLGRSHSDFISNLTYDFLTHCKSENGQLSLSLQFVNKNFPAMHTPVSGFPISCSRIIEGQVIHRDFATPCFYIDNQTIKAVVFTGYLQPKLLSEGEVLELGCGEHKMERGIMQFSVLGESLIECIIANLKSLGVSVLLSAVKQSAAVLALAAQADMCVVECVSEDELSLFAQLSGARPVTDCRTIEPEHVATLTSCRPILLGAQRYVHLGFHDSGERVMIQPCSLIICGPVEGQTDQYACAFQDAIRMLLSAWEPMSTTPVTTSKKTLLSQKRISLQIDDQIHRAPVLESGCVLPAGGTFEYLLNHALLQYDQNCSVSDGTNKIINVVPKLLAKALLSVPRQIYSHSPRCFLQTQARLLSLIQNCPKHFSVSHKEENTIIQQGLGSSGCPLEECKQNTHYCREAYMSSNGFMLNSDLESVSCKFQLLLAVLQCASSLLQVDAVLHTHTALHTQSHRHAKNSWEGTEDEPED